MLPSVTATPQEPGGMITQEPKRITENINPPIIPK
jgi:hypothetical protein